MEAQELQKQMQQFETSLSLLEQQISQVLVTGQKNKSIPREIARLKTKEEQLKQALLTSINTTYSNSPYEKEMLVENCKDQEELLYQPVIIQQAVKQLHTKMMGDAIPDGITNQFEEATAFLKIEQEEYLVGLTDGSLIYFTWKDNKIQIEEMLSLSKHEIWTVDQLEKGLYFAFDESQTGILFSKQEGVVGKIEGFHGVVIACVKYHDDYLFSLDSGDCLVYRFGPHGFFEMKNKRMNQSNFLAMETVGKSILCLNQDDQIISLSSFQLESLEQFDLKRWLSVKEG